MNRGFEIAKGFENDNITLPKRGTFKSAGYDFCAAKDTELLKGEVTLVPTGIKAYMQDDEVLQIYVRSSMAVKRHLMLANSVGIIDADYYNNEKNDGHIMIAIVNMGSEKQIIRAGERIAQGIFTKYLVTDCDEPTSNIRTGGIGSTGNF